MRKAVRMIAIAVPAVAGLVLGVDVASAAPASNPQPAATVPGPEWTPGYLGPEWTPAGPGPEWTPGYLGPEWDPDNAQPGTADLLEDLIGGLFRR